MTLETLTKSHSDQDIKKHKNNNILSNSSNVSSVSKKRSNSDV